MQIARIAMLTQRRLENRGRKRAKLERRLILQEAKFGFHLPPLAAGQAATCPSRLELHESFQLRENGNRDHGFRVHSAPYAFAQGFGSEHFQQATGVGIDHGSWI
jgi:hypothetical protein